MESGNSAKRAILSLSTQHESPNLNHHIWDSPTWKFGSRENLGLICFHSCGFQQLWKFIQCLIKCSTQVLCICWFSFSNCACQGDRWQPWWGENITPSVLCFSGHEQVLRRSGIEHVYDRSKPAFWAIKSHQTQADENKPKGINVTFSFSAV